MYITINTRELSKDGLIEFATMLSHEIDRLAVDSISLEQRDYDRDAQLVLQFKAVCNELTRTWGVTLSDCVPCPEYM